MKTIVIIAGLLAFGIAGAQAQKRDAGDRALGTELNRDRAETRIDRLRQDQRQNEQKNERANSRAQKPKGTATQQPR